MKTYIKNISTEELLIGKSVYAEPIKIALCQSSEDIIEKLDINNDDVFLDAFLYASLCCNNNSIKPTIEQLTFGFYEEILGKNKLPFKFNAHGIARFGNLFYVKTTQSNAYNQTCDALFQDKNLISIVLDEIEIDFTIIPFVYGDKENNIEIIQFNNSLFDEYFVADNPNYKNIGLVTPFEIEEITKHSLSSLKWAINFIQKKMPIVYEQIKLTTKKIIIYDAPSVFSFVHHNLHDAIFISGYKNASVLFFIEQVLHQASHNILNTLCYNPNTYFKQPVADIRLALFTKNENETRTIFGAFHGLLNHTHCAIAFNILQTEELHEIEKHELSGRFCDLNNRYHNGLEQINTDNFFTEKGKELYNELDSLLFNLLKQTKEKYKLLDLTNQPTDFDFNCFLKLNPLK